MNKNYIFSVTSVWFGSNKFGADLLRGIGDEKCRWMWPPYYMLILCSLFSRHTHNECHLEILCAVKPATVLYRMFFEHGNEPLAFLKLDNFVTSWTTMGF